MPRRTRTRQPVSVKQLAKVLPHSAFHTISWRQGSNAPLSGRFAAVRVRHAGGNAGRARLRPEEWLLIEWPAGDPEPLKYYLSTLPADTPLNDLVTKAHMRWRIERDYQDLKQELGLDHYEGRGWLGFHHHATLCIAAYGFLVSERIAAGGSRSTKKKFAFRQVPALPADYIPARQSCAHSATSLTSLATLRHQLSVSLLVRLIRCPLLRKTAPQADVRDTVRLGISLNKLRGVCRDFGRVASLVEMLR